MKKVKRNGFVMIFIIVLLALITAEMFALTVGSNTILFESNTAYLEACKRNLVASGLAWAEKNIKNKNTKGLSKIIELNLADTHFKKASLSIIMTKPENKQAEIQINASCSRGRQTLRHDEIYHIKL